MAPDLHVRYPEPKRCARHKRLDNLSTDDTYHNAYQFVSYAAPSRNFWEKGSAARDPSFLVWSPVAPPRSSPCPAACVVRQPEQPTVSYTYTYERVGPRPACQNERKFLVLARVRYR